MWEAQCLVTVLIWANTNGNVDTVLCTNRTCFRLLALKQQLTSSTQGQEQPDARVCFLPQSQPTRRRSNSPREKPDARISFFKPPTSLLLLALFLKGAKEEKAFFFALNKMITEASPPPLGTHLMSSAQIRGEERAGLPRPTVNKINFGPNSDKNNQRTGPDNIRLEQAEVTDSWHFCFSEQYICRVQNVI